MDTQTNEQGLVIKASIAEAARDLPQAPVRKGGLFCHPDTWTEEEDDIIATGLRNNLPLNVIAVKVNCERHCLSRHIENSPGLRQLKIDSRESRIDQAEFQADRLVKAGNPSMVMFTLERLGKERGWGQQDAAKEGEEESRIVFGEIPESEVARAKDAIADIVRSNQENKVFESDPMKSEMAAEAASSEMKEEARDQTSQVETVSNPDRVSPAPYENEDTQGQNSPFDDGSGENFSFEEYGDSPFGL